MSKTCDKCGKPYSGFGTTCSECRKTKGASAPAAAAGGDSNHCVVCKKVAYAMEKIIVEGETFHPTCFRCAHCNNKLSPGSFSKSNEGLYYCKVHYAALFKLRGRYDFPGGQKIEGSTSADGEKVEEPAAPVPATEECAPAAQEPPAVAVESAPAEEPEAAAPEPAEPAAPAAPAAAEEEEGGEAPAPAEEEAKPEVAAAD
mmetsp:Transcript_20033/g.46636  ORF Transcript_20033/g.46636 Transcript_20033/m.46636 type:complete len:201 (+) Transcript_20033:74-676(+)